MTQPARHTRRGAALTAAAALTVGLLTATPASAKVDYLSPQAEVEITAFLAENGVPDDVRKRLIARADAGHPWDNHSGNDPVSTEVTSDGVTQRTVYRYKDGSVSVEEVSLPQAAVPEGQVSVFSVSQCRLVSGNNYYATYDNCFVSRNDGTQRASFRVGYTKYAGGTQAVINSARNLSLTYYLGEYSGEKLSIQTKTATRTTQAKARAQWKVTVDYPAPLGKGSYTGHLEFKLNANGTYASGYRL